MGAENQSVAAEVPAVRKPIKSSSFVFISKPVKTETEAENQSGTADLPTDSLVKDAEGWVPWEPEPIPEIETVKTLVQKGLEVLIETTELNISSEDEVDSDDDFGDADPVQLSTFNMGGTASKSTPPTPQSPNRGTTNFITPKYEVVNTTPKSNDIFRQCNSEVSSIQKSQSQSRISIHNELQKSASKSKFLDNVREKKEIERKREGSVKRERSASQAKIDAEGMEIRKKRQDSESRKTSVVSPTPTEKKTITNEPKSKLDQIFGGLRDAPAVQQAPQTIAVTSVYTDPDFDPGLKEVKGMTESVKLKKSTKKPVKEELKKEKIKFELPAKKPK